MRHTRRQFVTAVGLVAATLTSRPAAALATSGTQEAFSANRWPIAGDIRTYGVEGCGATALLRSGAVATVLLHVIRRFHYEVSALGAGDISSRRTSWDVGAAFESNYLSGTAFAIRPGCYPVGGRGNLFPHEVVTVRDILAECAGVVRWAGDDHKMPKEGHFQIDVGPDDKALTRLAGQIAEWDSRRGAGAGTPPDVFDPRRRAIAERLAQHQRTT